MKIKNNTTNNLEKVWTKKMF
ncbi:hypothetical protein ACTFIR_010715 [Dictyostelium discoideum]